MLVHRHQHPLVETIYDLTVSDGQHGKGVYTSFPSEEMDRYYSRNGERKTILEINDIEIEDCTDKVYTYWEAKTKMYNSKKAAFMFRHEGYGIPTGIEILITKIEKAKIIPQ